MMLFLLIICSLCKADTELQKQVITLGQQLNQVSMALKRIEQSIPAPKSQKSNGISSLNNYFKLATESMKALQNQYRKLISDNELMIEVIKFALQILTIYFIFISIGLCVSLVTKYLLSFTKNGFVSEIIAFSIDALPEFLGWILYYVPNIAILLNIDLSNFFYQDPAFMEYIHYFSNISLIFFIQKSIALFIKFLRTPMNLASILNQLVSHVLFIKICKISCNSFVLVTGYNAITSFKESMNHVEIALVFGIVIYFIFRLRNSVNLGSMHIKSIIKYMSLPIIFSAIFAYTSNSNEANFIYKLMLAISVMPLLNKIYSLGRYLGFNYIKTFPKSGRKYVIQTFLTVMNLGRFLLIPFSILIVTSIFGINFIYELESFAGGKVVKILAIAFLLFIARIASIVNMYFWIIYEQRNVLKRPFDKQRIQTFSYIIKNIISTFIWLISLFIFLSVLGLDISPLFQSVGFMSAALSFSLQDFIRDIVNGLFILYDNSIKVGDLIEYEHKTAIVEVMHIRYIRIRFDDGLLITIPFNKIDLIRNKSRQQSYIIFNISFARNVDIKIAEEVIAEAFKNIKERPEFKYKILKDIELRDVAEVTAFSYVMQSRICVQPNSQYKIKRALNRELKLMLDKHNVELAFPPVANAINSPSLSTGDTFPDFQ
jgi:small conductance mechanosensitive channel